MAHWANCTLSHGAVENLVVVRPEPGGIDDMAVLGDVLDDRLHLLRLVAQVLQGSRHRLVDDLHGTAADQFLEFDQSQIRFYASCVTIHHQAYSASRRQ